LDEVFGFSGKNFKESSGKIQENIAKYLTYESLRLPQKIAPGDCP
jgi:hypothetical protein